MFFATLGLEIVFSPVLVTVVPLSMSQFSYELSRGWAQPRQWKKNNAYKGKSLGKSVTLPVIAKSFGHKSTMITVRPPDTICTHLSLLSLSV